MKKLILSILAFSALLASCTMDETTFAKGKALVKFNVAASEIDSRVYGDGVTTNDLQYAFYEKGRYDKPLFTNEIENAFNGSTMSYSFTEKLATGKTYIALFWADSANDPYEVDWETQTVKIADTAALIAQDENLDAFFKCHEIVVGHSGQTEQIELKRPFAQLNIGTSDTADAERAGLVVDDTEVSVRAYTTLNLLNGEVANAMQLTYAANAVPTGENATFTINNKTYDRLAMNYLLVNTKELVDVTFTTFDGNEQVNTIQYSKVPVERNYKTFIVGELLTSGVDFEVIILPDWTNPDYIWTGEEESNENVVTADFNMSDEEDNLCVLQNNYPTISNKVFKGQVTIDANAQNRYKFFDVKFEKTLNVQRIANLYFENVEFASPAINWSNNPPIGRRIHITNCTVNGEKITERNVANFFESNITVIVYK